MEIDKDGKRLRDNNLEQLSWLDIMEDSDEIVGELSTIFPVEDQKNKGEHKQYPVQLINDFEIFINYFGNNVPITKTKGHISRKHLVELNRRLSVKNDRASIHIDQIAYPYIHFLYYIAISGRILKKRSTTLQLTDRLDLFEKLTLPEKYLFILETFWVDLNWDELFDRSYFHITHSVQETFYNLIRAMNSSFSEDEREFNEIIGEIAIQTRNWNHFLLYFEWLGFWKCEKDQKAINEHYRKNHYFASSITLTEWGSQIIPILLFDRNLQFWNIPLRREFGEINPIPGSPLEDPIFILPEKVDNVLSVSDAGVGDAIFIDALKKCFPGEDVKNSLPREVKSFVKGQHTFKVIYTKGVWRSLVLSGNHTMEQLHELILEAYDFDDDHLYSFFMDGKKWSNKCIVSKEDGSGNMQANDIRIGEVGLFVGQSFMYLFDYGDEWTFTVLVEEILENNISLIKPHIKEMRGNAPNQYEYWD